MFTSKLLDIYASGSEETIFSYPDPQLCSNDKILKI
jgi:hypothetical protein